MIEEANLHAAVFADFGLGLERAHYGPVAGSFAGLTRGSQRRRIGPWLVEACRRAEMGERLAALVPARTDTRWWWNYCRFGEVHFLKGRVRFAGERSGAPFPSAVVLLGPGARADVVYWWNPNTGERSEHSVTA